MKVKKISGKPFKSKSKINTVKGIVSHPWLPGELGYTFEEDDSIVRISYCQEVLDLSVLNE